VYIHEDSPIKGDILKAYLRFGLLLNDPSVMVVGVPIKYMKAVKSDKRFKCITKIVELKDKVTIVDTHELTISRYIRQALNDFTSELEDKELVNYITTLQEFSRAHEDYRKYERTDDIHKYIKCKMVSPKIKITYKELDVRYDGIEDLVGVTRKIRAKCLNAVYNTQKEK
jgi:hypothetical protein